MSIDFFAILYKLQAATGCRASSSRLMDQSDGTSCFCWTSDLYVRVFSDGGFWEPGRRTGPFVTSGPDGLIDLTGANEEFAWAWTVNAVRHCLTLPRDARELQEYYVCNVGTRVFIARRDIEKIAIYLVDICCCSIIANIQHYHYHISIGRYGRTNGKTRLRIIWEHGPIRKRSEENG